MFLRETPVRRADGKVVKYLHLVESLRVKGKRYPIHREFRKVQERSFPTLSLRAKRSNLIPLLPPNHKLRTKNHSQIASQWQIPFTAFLWEPWKIQSSQNRLLRYACNDMLLRWNYTYQMSPKWIWRCQNPDEIKFLLISSYNRAWPSVV